MEHFTLNTNFSLLTGAETHEWIQSFPRMVTEAFAGSNDRTRLLGNLLVLEQYVRTLQQGMSEECRDVSDVLKHALDLLWEYLEGHTNLMDFEEFANNLNACVLAYNTGESLTDTQEDFFKTHFPDGSLADEWLALEWCAILLMTLVINESGRVDFEDCPEKAPIDFYGLAELLTLLEDACIELTDTPKLSDRAVDLQKACSLVHQTPLFRQIVKNIQNSLKTALTAEPGQFAALREEYRNNTILPKEYAADLLKY
ncbi:MAG: hypothetical protein J6C19_11910 [Lachnospiraceae bacterium]|nr:hypothetical protein [Lachnospiraceae bacterium]